MLNDELVAAGRRAVERGELLKLRKRLGFSRNAMAEMLSTARVTYVSWEEGTVTIRPQSAERIGRFVKLANSQLAILREHKIRLKDLVPLHDIAGQLGVPHEVLLYCYRGGLLPAEDLGILGLWVRRSDIPALTRVVQE